MHSPQISMMRRSFGESEVRKRVMGGRFDGADEAGKTEAGRRET